jgi:hypothetical protein
VIAARSGPGDLLDHVELQSFVRVRCAWLVHGPSSIGVSVGMKKFGLLRVGFDGREQRMNDRKLARIIRTYDTENPILLPASPVVANPARLPGEPAVRADAIDAGKARAGKLLSKLMRVVGS